MIKDKVLQLGATTEKTVEEWQRLGIFRLEILISHLRLNFIWLDNRGGLRIISLAENPFYSCLHVHYIQSLSDFIISTFVCAEKFQLANLLRHYGVPRLFLCLFSLAYQIFCVWHQSNLFFYRRFRL